MKILNIVVLNSFLGVWGLYTLFSRQKSNGSLYLLNLPPYDESWELKNNMIASALYTLDSTEAVILFFNFQFSLYGGEFERYIVGNHYILCLKTVYKVPTEYLKMG